MATPTTAGAGVNANFFWIQGGQRIQFWQRCGARGQKCNVEIFKAKDAAGGHRVGKLLVRYFVRARSKSWLMPAR